MCVLAHCEPDQSRGTNTPSLSAQTLNLNLSLPEALPNVVGSKSLASFLSLSQQRASGPHKLSANCIGVPRPLFLEIFTVALGDANVSGPDVVPGAPMSYSEVNFLW